MFHERQAVIRRSRRIRAHLRLMRVLMSANLSAAIEYRVNFLLQVFGMALNNLVFIIFWKFLLDRIQGLGDYQFSDILFIWALCSTAFGLTQIVFGNVRGLSEIVRSGDLDVYLLQPKDILLNVAASKTAVSGWGDLIFGIVVLAILLPDVLHIGLFVLATFTGSLVFAGIFAIGECLVFWLGSSRGLSTIIFEFVLSFSLYPESIFPQGMKWLMYSLLPSGFIIFLPIQIFRHPDPGLLLIVIVSAVLYPLLAWLLFRIGLKRYESGNRIGARN